MSGNMIKDGDFVMSNSYSGTEDMIGVVNNLQGHGGFHVNFGPDKMDMHDGDGKSSNYYYLESNVQKLEVGDKVRMKTKSVWGTIRSSGVYKRSDDGVGYVVDFDTAAGQHVVTVGSEKGSGSGDYFMAHDLEFISKGEEEMTQFKVDDIIKDEDGDYRKVLGFYGNYTYLSQWHEDYDEAIGDDGTPVYSYTKYEVEDFTLVDEKPLKEVSMQEIADKFGVKVEELRVKE